MKDAYSFNAGDESLEESYQAMAQAYRNIYRRCNLPVLMAEADSGAIGGKDSHEFILADSTSGEDTVITCPGCGYTANAEKAVGRAAGRLPSEPEATAAEETCARRAWGPSTELARFLDVPEEKTIKAVFYAADGRGGAGVGIRGDLEVNEVKLKNAAARQRAAPGRRRRGEAPPGLVAGSASAVGLSEHTQAGGRPVDHRRKQLRGGGEPAGHPPARTPTTPGTSRWTCCDDIALAQPGHHCAPSAGSTLEAVAGASRWATSSSWAPSSARPWARPVPGPARGGNVPITMGCYGIGVGRLLAAAIEQNHDERGIVFPPPVAPYQAHLVALNMSDSDVVEAADRLYRELWDRGVETLYDDRIDQAAGVKFNDADLLGLPLRLVVSPRNLKNGQVEVKGRTDAEAEMVPLGSVVEAVAQRLAAGGGE